MFSTYNGSKKFIEIETGVGKKVRCHLPKPPRDKNEIKNSHLPSNKQMWRRTELPTFFANEVDIFLFDKDYDKNSIVSWDEARRQEIIKQTGHDPAQEHRGKPKRILQNHEIDPQYVCEALEQYRQSEYRKVFGTDDWPGGEYVYINGELIYLTRFHYFYLNYWKLNTGWAEYRRTDRNGFYLWQWVLINPYLYGISELCKRGQGKSYRAGAIAYLTAISHERAHIGIQSKTDDDAANFFRSKIAEPYKDLPDYLVPLNRNPSDPQNKLEFYPIPLRGSRSEGARRGAEDSLRTTLDFRAARNGSYDGWTLKCYICDEAGKVESKVGDISKRLDILKEAVFRDGRLVGKMYITTTVEDMDGGGNTFEHVWKDGKKYNNQDIPISRFLNYFIKAEESTFFDPFGNPVINPAVKSQYSYLLKRYGEHALLGGREYHKGRKKELEGDSNAYIGYCQRNPNSDGEAFMVRGKGCQYNAAILQKQQRILSDPANANLVNRVDFEWIEEDKTVRWVPNPENGRFDLSWSFLEAEKEANRIRFETDFNNFVTKFPLNDVNFAIGFDPFKAGVTHSNKGKSNAGLAIFRKENLLYDPGQSNTFVCDYVFRPNDPEESYEDLIKVCVFFGCKVLIESQIDDGIRYMNRRGYEPFVMKRPPDTMTTYTAMAAGAPGLPSSQTVVDLYIKRMKSHIQNYGDRLKQPRIVKDLLMFEPDNRTKYDLAVASHLALLAAENPHAVEEEKDEYDVEDLFPMLD